MYAVANGMSKLDSLLAGTLVLLRCSWGGDIVCIENKAAQQDGLYADYL